MAIRVCGQSRQLSQHTINQLIYQLRILLVQIATLKSWICIGIEGAQSRATADQKSHRMRVVAKLRTNVLDIFVHKRVVHAMSIPFTELISRGQLTMNEEVCHLQIRAAFHEMFDPVTSVTEHAVVEERKEEKKKKRAEKSVLPLSPVNFTDIRGHDGRVGQSGIE
jgi:hypothetical protein